MSDFFPNRFAGRGVIVSGGGGDIGKATARRMAEEGARVALFDISADSLGRAKTEFEGLGLTCETFVCDVGREDSVNDSIAAAKKALGRIDIVVHTAAIVGPTGMRIVDITVEDYDKVYAANQRGSFLMAKAILPHMEQNGYGRLVMIASIAGKDGNPGMIPYTTTKAAVIGMVKALGKEYAETGVTVNGIAPAVIRTAMNADTSDEQLEYMTSKIPMGRLGEVDEVASLAAWICSEEASFTTGFIFDLSGGRATY